VALVDAVTGDWTVCTLTGISDGKRRRLSARSVLGASTSAWTTDIEILPSTLLPLSNYAVPIALLGNMQWSTTDSAATFTFVPLVPTSEVWAAYLVVSAAASPDFSVLSALVTPLPAGATSFVVPMPPDGYVTIVQIEGRDSSLVAGTVWRQAITATSQVPHLTSDDLETATTGTELIQLTERGLSVVSVQVQTQLGSGAFSSWGPPARGPGAVSVVRGGVLGPLAYEHDVPLDATRQTWITFHYTLANGAVITTNPFGFDRDKLPNLASATVAGSIVTILGDVDTKSVGLYAKSPGTWKYEIDGLSAAIDVTAVGTNGVAGLASGTSGVFTAKVLSDLVAYIGTGTLSDARDVTVLNGGTAPASVLSTVQVVAPTYSGSDQASITLKASAAPAGWTVKVYLLESSPSSASSPTTDATSLLTPTLSAPPTAATSYAYTVANPRSVQDSHSSTVSLRIRADLLDNTGTVKDTKTATAYWYTGGGFV
jgi:hypothetical protein